jgi:hypothetical protein
MYRYGLTVVVCLLVTGGLAAGQTSQGPTAMAGPLSTLVPPGLIGFSPPVCLSSLVPTIPTDNDVGVSKIVSPGEYAPLGDTVRPRAAVENHGLSVGLGIADDTIGVGHDTFFTISPNPLRRLAKVHYSLPKAGLVTLDVYDATGRGVLLQTIRTGRHGAAQLDLWELKAGVYFVKVKADGFGTTRKVVVER